MNVEDASWFAGGGWRPMRNERVWLSHGRAETSSFPSVALAVTTWFACIFSVLEKKTRPELPSYRTSSFFFSTSQSNPSANSCCPPPPPTPPVHSLFSWPFTTSRQLTMAHDGSNEPSTVVQPPGPRFPDARPCQFFTRRREISVDHWSVIAHG